jgi:MoxR-like ATPase
LKGRDFVTPDDIKAMAQPVLAHRLIVKGSMRSRAEASEAVLAAILRDVAVPTEENLISR